MIDAFKTNGSSPPDVSVNDHDSVRVPSMSEGVVEAYGRGRDRKWRWSARVKMNGSSVQYRRQGFDTKDAALADRDRVLSCDDDKKKIDVPKGRTFKPSDATMRRESLEAALASLRTDPAYFDKRMPNSKSVRARVTEIYEQLYPDDGGRS